MKLSPCLQELKDGWFPHITDAGLDRVIELLDKSSPLLIHGEPIKQCRWVCLATYIGWHHPTTCHWTMEAGIMWLSRIAGLNPATSQVIRAWDSSGPFDWDLAANVAGGLQRRAAAVGLASRMKK